MHNHARRLGVLIATASIALAACSSSGSTPAPSAPASAASSGGASANCASGSITASGSTALQPLVDAASKKYGTSCTGATISVQGGGSGTGLTQVLQGAVQIGDSDIFAEDKLKPDEAKQLVDHQVVRQGFVNVINPGVTGVTDLSTKQLQDIWTGKTTNWKDAGGPDQAIVLILRPASSGTRATFKKVVLNGADEAAGQALTEDSNGTVAQTVGQTPGAISYIGLAYFKQNSATLVGTKLDGVEASLDTIKSSQYKLQSFGHMYTKGEATGLAKAFLDYMVGPEAQAIAAGLFYAPAK